MKSNIPNNTIIIEDNIIYYRQNDSYIIFKGKKKFLREFTIQLSQKEKFLIFENIPFNRQIDRWIETISNIFLLIYFKRYSIEEEICFYEEYYEKILFICKFYKKNRQYFKNNIKDSTYNKYLIKHYFKLSKNLKFLKSILGILRKLKNEEENFYAELFKIQCEIPPILHKNLILITKKSNLTFLNIFFIEKTYFFKKHMVLRNNYNENLLRTNKKNLNDIFTELNPNYFVRRYQFLDDRTNYQFYVLLLYKHQLHILSDKLKIKAVKVVQQIIDILPNRICMRFAKEEYMLLNKYIKIAFKTFKQKPVINFKKITYGKSRFYFENNRCFYLGYLYYNSFSISLAKYFNLHLYNNIEFKCFLKFYKKHRKFILLSEKISALFLSYRPENFSLKPHYDEIKFYFNMYRKFWYDSRLFLNYKAYIDAKYFYIDMRRDKNYIKSLDLCVNRDCKNSRIGFKFKDNKYLILYHYDITIADNIRNNFEIKKYYTKRTKSYLTKINKKLEKYRNIVIEKEICQNTRRFAKRFKYLENAIDHHTKQFYGQIIEFFFIKYLNFVAYTRIKMYLNIEYDIDAEAYYNHFVNVVDQIPELSFNFTKKEYFALVKKLRYIFKIENILIVYYQCSNDKIKKGNTKYELEAFIWYYTAIKKHGELKFLSKQVKKLLIWYNDHFTNLSYKYGKKRDLKNLKMHFLMSLIEKLFKMGYLKYQNITLKEALFLDYYDVEREYNELIKEQQIKEIIEQFNNFKVNISNLSESIEKLNLLLFSSKKYLLDISDKIVEKINLLDHFYILYIKYAEYKNENLPDLKIKFNALKNSIVENFNSIVYEEEKFNEIYNLFKQIDGNYNKNIIILREKNPILNIVSKTILLQYIKRTISIYAIFVNIYNFDSGDQINNQIRFKRNKEIIIIPAKEINFTAIQKEIDKKIFTDFKFKTKGGHQYFISAFHSHLNNFLHKKKTGNQMTSYLSKADLTYFIKPTKHSSIAYSNRTDLIYTDYIHNIISVICLYEKYKKGIILYGKSGTGKTETIKYYTQIRNKKIVNFCCASDMTYDILIDIIEGVVKYGAYVLLDEFNRLSLPVICKFYTYLTTHDIFCFITINNTYGSRTELPITFTNLFGLIDGNQSNIYELIPHLYQNSNKINLIFKYLQSTDLFNSVYFDIRTIKMISQVDKCKYTAIYNFYSSMVEQKEKEKIKKAIEKIANIKLTLNSLSNEIYYALNNYRGIILISENENILRELKNNNNVFYEENDRFIENLQSRKNKYLIFDRELHSSWIENFNSVFDDNLNYRTKEGEKINISKEQRFIFIGPSIKNITPATLSRLPLIIDENKKISQRTEMVIENENNLKLISDKFNLENIISVSIDESIIYLLGRELKAFNDLTYLSENNLNISLDYLRYKNKYERKKYLLLNIKTDLFTHYNITITHLYNIEQVSIPFINKDGYLINECLKDNYAKLIYFTNRNFNLILRGKGWNYILRNSEVEMHKKLKEHKKFNYSIRPNDIFLFKSDDLPVTVIENIYLSNEIIKYCGYDISIEKANIINNLKSTVANKLIRKREYLKNSIKMIEDFHKKNINETDKLNEQISKLNEYINKECENMNNLNKKKIILNEKLILYRENKKSLDENLILANELNESLKKKLSTAEDNLRICQENIEKIDKNSLFELKNMNSPPTIVRTVLSVIYYIFTGNKSDNWNSIRKFIRCSEFIKNIKEKLNFAEEQLSFIRQFLKNDEITFSKIERASLPASILYIWIKSIYDNYMIKSESRPLAEENRKNKEKLDLLKIKIAEEEKILNSINKEIKNFNAKNKKINFLISNKKVEIECHKNILIKTENILKIFKGEKNNWNEKLNQYENLNTDIIIDGILKGNIKYLIEYDLPISIKNMGNLSIEYLKKIFRGDDFIIAEKNNFLMQFNFAVEHNYYIVVDEALFSKANYMMKHKKIILLERENNFSDMFFSHQVENMNFIGNKIFQSENIDHIEKYENDLLDLINKEEINYDEIFNHMTILNVERNNLLERKEENIRNKKKIFFINKLSSVFLKLSSISLKLNQFNLSEYVLDLFLEKNNFYDFLRNAFSEDKLNEWIEKIINFFSSSFRKSNFKIIEEEFSVKIIGNQEIVPYCNYVILYETNLDMLIRKNTFTFDKMLLYNSNMKYENGTILLFNADLIDLSFKIENGDQYFFAMKTGNTVQFNDMHIIYEEGERVPYESDCFFKRAINIIYKYCRDIKYDFTDDDERILMKEKNMSAFKLLFYNKLTEKDKIIFNSIFEKNK